ncbi:amidohydrolase family protein [Jannaschia sp. Os4]|uniref:amidohydrolase family protein n=1 Tax=Jannaschia sp. Os4 TaxID=2807617 RepID=UPI00193AC144|nr:amidohydrolase family protein [Jannaschia sp. Os4]MBM2576331.1 amidohydrolase family protein [Jannaschia sp. Os4]
MRLPSLAAATLLALSSPAAADLLIRGARVVDVEAGTAARLDVRVEDGTIAAVGPGLPAEGAEPFDAEGLWLIPGLWDAHVHVFSSPDEPDVALPLHVLHGVTGIRDMGALWPVEDQLALAADLEDGTRAGPRLVVSGAWVDAPPGSWPGMFLAATPVEARAAVDRIAAEGWTAVKAYSMLAPATYRALAEAADAHDLPLVGHVPETVTIRDALAAGQAGVAHWGRVTRGCATAEAATVADARAALASDDPMPALLAAMARQDAPVRATWDAARCRALLADMAAAGMHVTPTFVVADFYLGRRPLPDAPRMRTLPAAVRAAWEEPDFRLEAMTDDLRASADAAIALDRRTFALAVEAGVPILAGTDASFANPWIFHGASLPDELARYVAAGMTPRQALFAATAAAPRFLGLADQDGRIAPGRRADLVLLGGDPLSDIGAVRDVRAVVLRGQLLDRPALNRMRAGLEGRP